MQSILFLRYSLLYSTSLRNWVIYHNPPAYLILAIASRAHWLLVFIRNTVS
jgi:hypothetical protein